MDRSGAVLLALLGVSGVCFSWISGAEVEARVRPGDNAVLHSDCVPKGGFTTVWFRNCSHKGQPPLIITERLMPRYSFRRNYTNQSQNLLLSNVSESDLGVYYCALRLKDVYHFGKRVTRLSLIVDAGVMTPCADPTQTVPNTDLPQTTSTSPVADCSTCWKLLVSVCPLCVVLSSLLSSTCVYFICRTRTKVEQKPNHGKTKENQKERRSEEAGEDGVCYASLDLPSRGQKRQKKKKKKRVESSDFSTYSEVKFERVEIF